MKMLSVVTWYCKEHVQVPHGCNQDAVAASRVYHLYFGSLWFSAFSGSETLYTPTLSAIAGIWESGHAPQGLRRPLSRLREACFSRSGCPSRTSVSLAGAVTNITS